MKISDTMPEFGDFQELPALIASKTAMLLISQTTKDGSSITLMSPDSEVSYVIKDVRYGGKHSHFTIERVP